MPSKQPDRFITYVELAELLCLHVATVKKGECGTDSIPRIRLGKRVLFSFNAVQSWMAGKAREAEENKRRSQNAVTNLMNFTQRRKRYTR
jgi:hypothetical protein